MAPSGASAIDVLQEIARTLGRATDQSKGLTGALQVLAHCGLLNGTVSLFDTVTGEVFIEAAPEMADAERILGRLQPGEGIIGRVFRDGLPVAIPDLAEEPVFLNRTGSWRDTATQRRALYALPLRDGLVTRGVLTADRLWSAGPFSFDADMKLLQVVAGLMAPWLRLHELAPPVKVAGPPGEGGGDLAPLAARAIVGVSPAWREVLDVVARVAPSRATVLLRGESGTGKEVIARAVHDASPRAERPFVAVSCAALPETLVESTLFGHERGAFTGAHQAQEGRFEAADGGTLFLDEVGELPPSAQAKLLRAIQERQFERVGGRRTLTVDVRLVAATNRDLEAAVRDGQFRLDLYHRLQVIELHLPPLRQRPEDIPALAAHFLAQLAEEHGRAVTLDREAAAALTCAPWPGNARQLRNALERLVVAHPEPRVTANDLRPLLEGQVAPPKPLTGAGRAVISPEGGAAEPAGERERVVEALARAGHVQTSAARLLGLTVRQLRYRVAKYGIKVERF